MNPLDLEMISEATTRLLRAVDPNPQRSGLIDTPGRVARYWAEMTAGYDIEIASLFKIFDDGAGQDGDLVIVSKIPVISSCEHHLALFHGEAAVGYIPQGERIVGLSKIARLVDAFSRRLQTQERITRQVADAMVENLEPKGVMVVLRCFHSCMAARGARASAMTTTSAVRGCFENDAPARAEFLSLMKE